MIQDLDIEAIEAAFEAVGLEINEGKLESFELARIQNDQLTPTHAGLLLFGKDLSQFLPDAYFRAIRYPGPDKGSDVIDSAEWPGRPLLAVIGDVENFISRNTGTAQTMEGRRRRDVPYYDYDVLRELLHNAIAHADYSAGGMHINISIYSDRLVIDSPGQMPVGMSVEQLKEGISRIRNRTMMNVLHILGYVEKHGTAYAKALEAGKRGYPLPEWSEPGPILRVTLPPHPQALQAPKGGKAKRIRHNREQEICDYLAQHGETTVATLSEGVGVSDRQVRTYLRRLEGVRKIKQSGTSEFDPTKTYRLADQPGS